MLVCLQLPCARGGEEVSVATLAPGEIIRQMAEATSGILITDNGATLDLSVFGQLSHLECVGMLMSMVNYVLGKVEEE